ncbi:polysaccharide deacetylase family protein [Spirosoma soli]|uniref:Polysaccharide deacetylase family protein n=1 Tax=Spirosoma soli TaxID=1770529 RepID=A0ABW5LZ03_9BACT
MKRLALLLVTLFALGSGNAQIIRQPIPDKLVVLTFDDASISHARFVAPVLKRYGFGGTFFICEFPPNFFDKSKYMSWAQIRELDRMGFEIGNHTLTHKHVNKLTREQFTAELDSLEFRCLTYGITHPTTFAYPGYDTHPTAFSVLKEKNYAFARVGGSRTYDPTTDHPFLIPSFSTTGTDKQRVLAALQEAKNGKIVVLTIHGVPDNAHDWVTTPPDLFLEYMKFLHDNRYTVIALRDLAAYVNVEQAFTTIALKP